MTPEYLFPHHIVLGYIVLWTVLELIAVRIWPIRESCKKISLLHCIAAFLITSAFLARRFWTEDVADASSLYNFEVQGSFEHHVVTLSMTYFIVDMPFCLAFHQAFIVHHIICIVAFAAIQGYWKYLPGSTHFALDFMAWDTTPKLQHSQTEENDMELQLLLGGLNGIFNLWMAELGGVFFHINRALKDTDMELPSRGLFLLMFTVTRCFVWPTYIWHVFLSAAKNDTYFHKVSATLETGLFLTNLHFLYKNVAPIWKTGRLIPGKPKGFHRKWFDKHPLFKKVAGVFLHQDKISMSPSLEDDDSALSDVVPVEHDKEFEHAKEVDSDILKKKN